MDQTRLPSQSDVLAQLTTTLSQIYTKLSARQHLNCMFTGKLTDKMNAVSVDKLNSGLQSLLIMNETLDEDWDHQEFLTLSMKRLGLHFADEFLGMMTDEDLIEGYNLENIQIFRNLRFMEICGYTLEYVLAYEWPELYERSMQITQQLITAIHQACNTGQIVPLDHIPSHYMKERISEDRQISEVRFRYMVPLFAKAAQPAGFLCVSRAHIVDTHPERHELRFL